jgi:hypothetical protein
MKNVMMTLALALAVVVSNLQPANGQEAPKTEKVPPVLLKALTDCGDPSGAKPKWQTVQVMEMGKLFNKNVNLSSVTSPSLRTTISCGEKTGVMGTVTVGKVKAEVLVCQDPASGIALTVGAKEGNYNVPKIVFVPWDSDKKTFGDAIVVKTVVKDSVKIDDKGNWNAQFLPPNQFDVGYFVIGWGEPTPVAVKK